MLNSHTVTADEVTRIAQRAHEANRQYRRKIGEDPGPRWDEAPDEMRDSIRNGVLKALDGATPEQLHQSWMHHKLDAGWIYGEGERNDEKKTHPQLLPYSDLPEAQKEKDELFQGSVRNGVREALRKRREPLERLFTYQPPRADQLPRYEQLRAEAKSFAETLVALTPVGADQSAAIRKLRECVMTANAAISQEI